MPRAHYAHYPFWHIILLLHVPPPLLGQCLLARSLLFFTRVLFVYCVTQTLCASALPTEWGRLVCGCCGDDHPAEVKLAVTEVLVNSTAPLLAGPTLPLGESPPHPHFCPSERVGPLV